MSVFVVLTFFTKIKCLFSGVFSSESHSWTQTVWDPETCYHGNQQAFRTVQEYFTVTIKDRQTERIVGREVKVFQKSSDAYLTVMLSSQTFRWAHVLMYKYLYLGLFTFTSRVVTTDATFVLRYHLNNRLIVLYKVLKSFIMFCCWTESTQADIHIQFSLSLFVFYRRKRHTVLQRREGEYMMMKFSFFCQWIIPLIWVYVWTGRVLTITNTKHSADLSMG